MPIVIVSSALSDNPNSAHRRRKIEPFGSRVVGFIFLRVLPLF